MKPRASSDSEWLDWIEVQKRATELWEEGDLAAAIAEVDRFLELEPPVDLERQAIGFRGSLHEERGNTAAARADYLTARSLSERRDFERYSLELAAGAASELMGEVVEAERWYAEALATAAADLTTSGAGALLRLLRTRGERGLSAEERALADQVVRQAWSHLQVEGEPDLGDLVATAQELMKAQGQPRKPPAPNSTGSS